MKQLKRRGASIALVGSLVVSMSGCGTLFHPERKGQLSGNVDPVVAIANGVGLLFFILPGVIAYAVDFSNGTIYLPSNTSASIDTFTLDDTSDLASLERILSDKAGQPVDLHNELMIMEEVESLDEALAMVRMSGVHDSERLGVL
ncbi:MULTISPECIES: hypothetical protein [unclassified Halomonas]|uniref:hypothetical protein n=1 Tax=unclassified Halomonas TaxID=2609666 RepID=UPI0021E44D27|nr:MULTISPECIES: hypothetical protein [unclassified Halomonas]UYG01524.1 hypothetical protein OCT39_08250 [Halomonas sp. GD1P12]WNL37419.1 hypothetical protein RN346_08785 [Halomonas sp. PAMB 3232]